MTRSPRSTTGLRRPLAVASVLALTSGMALGLAPAASARGTGGNGGDGEVFDLPYLAPSGASAPLPCTDDNLDRLGRATGGEMHALEKDGLCLIVHIFSADGTFTLDARHASPMQVMVVGAGGGGGGGSGWEDSTKASGAEPESGAGAGGSAGWLVGGSVQIKSGGFTAYTPTSLGSAGFSASQLKSTDGEFIYTPTATLPPTTIPVTVGTGGSAGTAGSSTGGSTVGGQGGRGGDSSFGEFLATGGGGGFGGTGAEGSEPGVQVGTLGSPRAGGQRGGSNATFDGGDLGTSPTIDHAAPGGAGATENGQLPVAAGPTGNGGNGGAGFVTSDWEPNETSFGDGGGGGTVAPGQPGYPVVLGGKGGNDGAGGNGGAGGAGGDGEDAPDGFGGGGGGGGNDVSITPGNSNAGAGGRGGDGVVLVRYLALSAPATPPAPIVTPGDGSVTLTMSPLDTAADYYFLWVAGDPDRSCTITPPESSCVIEGLDNGAGYTFLTAAGNAAGYSAASSESPVVTPGLLPYTGSSTRDLAALALIMIGLGGGISLLTRRRRSIID